MPRPWDLNHNGGGIPSDTRAAVWRSTRLTRAAGAGVRWAFRALNREDSLPRRKSALAARVNWACNTQPFFPTFENGIPVGNCRGLSGCGARQPWRRLQGLEWNQL